MDARPKISTRAVFTAYGRVHRDSATSFRSSKSNTKGKEVLQQQHSHHYQPQQQQEYHQQ
jgi:hypothetical protein